MTEIQLLKESFQIMQDPHKIHQEYNWNSIIKGIILDLYSFIVIYSCLIIPLIRTTMDKLIYSIYSLTRPKHTIGLYIVRNDSRNT